MFNALWHALGARARRRTDPRNWRCDPLAHPDVSAMNQRELADLPFEPFFTRAECGCGPQR